MASQEIKGEMGMVLEIAQLGQPVLRMVAAEIPPDIIGAPEFQEILARMLATLRHHKGAGLAGPQVFLNERVFLAAILPPESDDEDAPHGVEVFINPKLTPLGSERSSAWEGCLSFPELLVKVPRWQAVRIDYLNTQGEPRALELREFPARVVQHELDHLDGILTLDRAPSTRDIVKASEIETVLEAEDKLAGPASDE
jgi:peptide deformylase